MQTYMLSWGAKPKNICRFSSPSHIFVEFFLWIKSIWVFAYVFAMLVFKPEAWDKCTLYRPRQPCERQVGALMAAGMQMCTSWEDICSLSFLKVFPVPTWLLILHWIHSIPMVSSFMWLSWSAEDPFCYVVEHNANSKLYSGNLQYELQ